MSKGNPEAKPQTRFRQRLHEIIFESDTFAGRAFDMALIAAILASVLLVMLESVPEYRTEFGDVLYAGEWFFTVLFTVEMALRLLAVRNPFKYLFSFFGIVDVLAVIPTYLSLLIPGTQSLLVIRIFRILRIFRIFKLSNYLGQAQVLFDALRTSRPKIIVFLVAVFGVVITAGTVMYLVEGEANGFTSIPKGIYWAIVTMTTVGFGDLTPKTSLGQFLASGLMIVGYGILAVPTGIVTSELVKKSQSEVSGQACPNCGHPSHDIDALYCKRCGFKL